MILVAKLVLRASFRNKRKAKLFFKIAVGATLFGCSVNICSAKTFLELSEPTTSVFLKILQILPKNTCVGVCL